MKCNFGWATSSLCPARAGNGRRLRRRRGLSRTINAISLGRLGRDVFCPRIAIGPGALPPPRPGFFMHFNFGLPWRLQVAGHYWFLECNSRSTFRELKQDIAAVKRDLGLEVPAHRRNRKQNSSPFQPDIHPDGGGWRRAARPSPLRGISICFVTPHQGPRVRS